MKPTTLFRMVAEDNFDVLKQQKAMLHHGDVVLGNIVCDEQVMPYRMPCTPARPARYFNYDAPCKSVPLCSRQGGACLPACLPAPSLSIRSRQGGACLPACTFPQHTASGMLLAYAHTRI